MAPPVNDVKMPRKRNSTKGARTKAHIKQVARAIFEREGHAGVTAQAIVEAAGISSGTFYVYFSNKDEVLLEICHEFLDSLIAGIAESHTGQSIFEDICRGTYAYIRPIVDNWTFYRALISYGLVEPRLREAQHEARLREAERTQMVLERVWRETGSPHRIVDSISAVQMAMMLNAMTEGFIQDMLRGLQPGDAPSDTELREIATMLGRTFYRAAYLEDPGKA
jgi:TetR/AcrR family transcriptional regulator, ethionamide resistance regulator